MLLKRICAALLALACAGGLALAEGDEAPERAADALEAAGAPEMTAAELEGAWQLIEYGVDGEYYSDVDLAERAEVLELEAGGAAELERYGEREQGEWSLEDGAVALEVGDWQVELEYDGMALNLDDSGMSARYVRDTSALYALKYDGERAQQMCNLMNGGLFARDGDALYGLSWDEDGRAMLAERALTDGGAAGEARALDAGCIARYINLDGDMLYYVRDGLDGQSGVCALELDGGEPELLLEGKFNGLQLSGGRLYCLNAQGQLLSCDLSGGDARAEMDYEASFAYLLDGDWLLYQSASDLETLHACRLSDGYDLALTDERGYLPVLMGGYLYYFGRELDAEGAAMDDARLCRLELATGERERTAVSCAPYLAVNSDALFTANGYMLKDMDAWWTLQNADVGEVVKAPVYADDEYLISLEYSDGAAARVEIERLSDGAAVSVN